MNSKIWAAHSIKKLIYHNEILPTSLTNNNIYSIVWKRTIWEPNKSMETTVKLVVKLLACSLEYWDPKCEVDSKYLINVSNMLRINNGPSLLTSELFFPTSIFFCTELIPNLRKWLKLLDKVGKHLLLTMRTDYCKNILDRAKQNMFGWFHTQMY